MDSSLASEEQIVAHVGRRIRFLRTRRSVGRMTLLGVARKAGVSGPFLSMLERGRRSVSIAALEEIASALGVPLSDLFESPEDEPQVDRSTQRLLEYVRSRRLKSTEVEQLLAVARAMFHTRAP